jgi:t-SNARE complex subunit (syntaxin)
VFLGTLLDRVDQNLAMAEQHINESVKEITKANEHQKSARFKMCILFLAMAIIAIVITVIIFKSLG